MSKVTSAVELNDGNCKISIKKNEIKFGKLSRIEMNLYSEQLQFNLIMLKAAYRVLKLNV